MSTTDGQPPERHTPRTRLPSHIVDWFPLVPRVRPPAQALRPRVHEIRRLARTAEQGPDEARVSSATEALNKAALIASDCALADLARRLCWAQFDLFHTAAPLTAKRAKLALQPIANLGRLAAREGDNTRAYQIFHNAYVAVSTQTAIEIDGRIVDFQRFVSRAEDRQQPLTFWWTVLLADATRALTRAGQWADALRHIQRYKGIGKRMLDGRQVAILARCAADDHHTALDLLDNSATPDPWEQAIAAYLRTLCLRTANQPATAAAEAMITAYLRLERSPHYLLFRTRLGLSIIDLAADPPHPDNRHVLAMVISEAAQGGDAHSASDVLSHRPCRSTLTQAHHTALASIIESSGLRRGTIPTGMLDDLLASAKASEEQLAHLLTPGSSHQVPS